MKKHICIYLLLLSACSPPGPNTLASTGSSAALPSTSAATVSPSSSPLPSPASSQPPEATDNISAVAGGGNMGNPDILATPTPFPSSETPPGPEQIGPTAFPSRFSPQCPAGETYTQTFPSPQATAPQYPFPTPLPPYLATYTFTLPIGVSQYSFCGTGTPRNWFIDSQQVLSYQEENRSPQRTQLNSEQTQDILTLLNRAQPQQWVYPPEPAYRCQAAELCPLEHRVTLGTKGGGETSWNDRGNIAYVKEYTQTLEQLMEKLETARQNSAKAPSENTYRSALSVQHFSTTEQIEGLGYALLPEGTLHAFQNNVMFKEVQLTAEQLADFQKRLQALSAMETYQRLVGDISYPETLANETSWQFEYERTGDIFGPYGGAIALSKLPDNAEGNALKANLDALVNQLKAYLSESTP